MKPVIDVSVHNGDIDWDRAKDFIDGAIIRCGYGSDYTSQDDHKWIRNVTECERLGIPYAVYLYSYARSSDQARSEAEHAIRLCQGHKPSVVYFDSEEPGTGGIARSNASIFIDKLRMAGFKAGVYASTSWYKSYLFGIQSDSLWLAAYGSNNGQAQKKYRPNLGEDLWQYSSVAVIPGVGKCDVNIMYKNIFNTQPKPDPSPEPIPNNELLELVAQTLEGKYGNGDDRVKYLGKNYNAVQDMINHIFKASATELATEVITGKYGNNLLRKRVLGSRYAEVQDMVNKILA